MKQILSYNKISQTCHAYPKASLLTLIVLAAGLGFLIGLNVNVLLGAETKDSFSQLRQKGNYKFINALLECDNYKEEDTSQSKRIEASIQKIAQKVPNLESIDHLSVYYRDLIGGAWIGYNENEKFSPASLLKVPMMMSYFKKTEDDPGLLDKKVVFEKVSNDFIAIQNISPDKVLVPGKTYKIDEIIQNMIVYSDNDALAWLTDNIDQSDANRIYKDLMIPNPVQQDSPENFMTVREYASFFRILYNASYLDKKMSDKALGLLSQVNFKDGLVAGVPEGTVVSHKFGEREFENYRQLHDCGIVYNSQRPYLLCVMTRGNDIDELKKMIKEVSRTVWGEVIK